MGFCRGTSPRYRYPEFLVTIYVYFCTEPFRPYRHDFQSRFTPSKTNFFWDKIKFNNLSSAFQWTCLYFSGATEWFLYATTPSFTSTICRYMAFTATTLEPDTWSRYVPGLESSSLWCVWLIFMRMAPYSLVLWCSSATVEVNTGSVELHKLLHESDVPRREQIA